MYRDLKTSFLKVKEVVFFINLPGGGEESFHGERRSIDPPSRSVASMRRFGVSPGKIRLMYWLSALK